MSEHEHPVNENGILILDGKTVAASIKQNIINEMELLRRIIEEDKFVKPKLAIVSVGDNPASKSYIKGKVKDCEECGFDVMVISVSEDASLREIESILDDLSYDDSVHGIILQLPLPEKFSKDDVRMLLNCIDPVKDVDCLTNENIGKLAHGIDLMRPCTPDGIMETLLYYNIPISGRNVVIINRSDIVGKPLATMMTQADATVTLCHSKTKNLESIIKMADIVVVAVGQEGFINEHNIGMLNPWSVVIDVGINRNSEGKLVGDVDYNAVAKYAAAKAITPVPGGVGLTTRASLMRNVFTAYTRRYRSDISKTNMK